MSLTIGSLFSGIGGLELGLERAGLGPTLFQVEQSEYCRAVLAKHWPAAERFDDVRTVGAHNLPRVDVICGGFPCQDISYAGKGAGLDGERSGLWYEFARIVREMGPRYVVVENVRALLVRGIDSVLGTLADLGYDAEWSCIRAFDVGAPHLRDRVFILAYPNAHEPRLEGRDRGELRERAGEQPARPVGASLAHADDERPQGGRLSEGFGGRPLSDAHGRGASLDGRAVRPSGVWDTEPNVGRVAHGIPARVDRLRALGNAVVPEVAEVVGRLIADRESLRGAA